MAIERRSHYWFAINSETKTMPKTREDYSAKLFKYVRDFGDLLTTDGKRLQCNACNKEIRNAFKKFSVKQHFATNAHTEAIKTFTAVDGVRDMPSNCLAEDDTTAADKCDPNLLSIINLIVDKVHVFINECTCDLNKKEIKQLIAKYRKISNQTKQVVDTSADNKSKAICETGITCPWPGCDRQFKLSSQLKPHLRTHTGEKQYRCSYNDCGKTFDRRSTLAYHNEKHKTGLTYKMAKTVICSWMGCDKTFPFRYQMNQHYRTQHLRKIRFTCEWAGCGQGFISKDQYDVHIARQHIGHNLYRCEECEKRFSTKSNLQKHFNYIHLKRKRYKCEICEQTFIRKEQLDAHMVDVHNSSKTLTCDWPGCDFSTLYSRNIKSHRMRHTGEKPYKCSWPSCEWSFRELTHLKTHLLKHTGERPVPCASTSCKLAFQSKHAMRVHFNKTHINLSIDTNASKIKVYNFK